MAGIFVGVRITPASSRLIKQYTDGLTLPDDCRLLPRKEQHVTLIYSQTPLPVDYPLDNTHSRARVYDIRYIGNALALILESPWLRWRYKLARLCGYRSKYPGLIPHLSLAYDPPPGLPVAWWLKPNFYIELAGEYQEPVQESS